MESYRRVFENICRLFTKYTDTMPITFMLGFFINVVVNSYRVSALFVCKYISGSDDHARLLRRNIIRYLLFHQVLVFRDISEVIRRRFPSLETLYDSIIGYVTETELMEFNTIDSINRKYWVPIHWAMGLARRAYKEKRIDSPQALQDIYSVKLGELLVYDWVPIPLVYSQVMCLTVRLYFFLALMGHQNIAPSPNANYIDTVNTHIPFISMCQFIFYMGWMKVAEVLMNPFGDDDDDLEINWLIDRNLQVGMTIADQTWEPPLIKDQFWLLKTPEPMYSIDAVNERYNPQTGSVSNTDRRTSTQMIMKEVLLQHSDSDLASSEYDGRRRTSSISTTVNDIRNAFKRRMSRFTSRIESVTDADFPQQPFERHGLAILPEEDENRKQKCDSSSRNSSNSPNDECDNKILQSRKKGRKLRKKTSKVENESIEKEEESNSENSGKISYDGDDEQESQTEKKSQERSTQESTMEVAEAVEEFPETVTDSSNNQTSETNDTQQMNHL
ncbi:bestrophin-3 domain protein [Onchocerca flexuosa]|uniref:Bestrophin homolog n=1 Tax=Onchocerca flexuosa TaxID=387005 RepID=A0A238BSK7_9BILA|nr:bestrophin-3 domain protein [Onchocerca flexuosa]